MFIICLFVDGGYAQEQPLVAGMKISKSMRVKKGVYRLDAPLSLGESLIIIEGNNITVDFNQAELKGSNKIKKPDGFFGVAILVRNGQNITIKNCKAKGYKLALLARNVKNLTLENCDFSYNYRQQLNSSQEKENVSDWMSYHHNEKDEWLRYGAAIYLRDCDSATISHCRVTGGQNGLMMTGCDNGLVFSNDFSFNSGIGIGLYRSSGNRVNNNRLIFNVRGYSHGIYNRGQDSAGILVYEQSDNNIFYRNNVTHGGDGFFLWAGQTTMDTGKGGCNNNLISDNDFSYAPTNGIEVTFSSNKIMRNRIFECDHGIWGGYSYQTVVEGNQFRNNRIAVAIEHGQQNSIVNNLFVRDKEAIKLWARKEQPADWGYAKYRDTRSAGYTIAINSFNNNGTVYNLSRTDSIELANNSYSGIETMFKVDSTVTHIDSVDVWDHRLSSDPAPIRVNLHDKFNPFEGAGKYAGRKNIRVTEWGPYDFRSPLIWLTNPTSLSDTLKFDLLGPKGKWVIKNFRGVHKPSATKGEFPASFTAQKLKGETTDIVIELEYVGESITTPFGEKLGAGKSYKFYFRKFFQPIDWDVLFFSMDTTVFNPLRETGLFAPNVRMAPVKTERVNKLDYAWWGGIKTAGQSYQQFITVAAGSAALKPGTYELAVTWDDAVRVYIDEKLVLDEWNPSLYKFDESPHRKIKVQLSGNPKFRVEHLELGGFATLALSLKPVQ